jgi:hypothetical protein
MRGAALRIARVARRADDDHALCATRPVSRHVDANRQSQSMRQPSHRASHRGLHTRFFVRPAAQEKSAGIASQHGFRKNHSYVFKYRSSCLIH